MASEPGFGTGNGVGSDAFAVVFVALPVSLSEEYQINFRSILPISIEFIDVWGTFTSSTGEKCVKVTGLS